MFKVKKRTLLLIAGIVWLIAGFNVARLGVLSYLVIERQWFMYLLSVVVFVAFDFPNLLQGVYDHQSGFGMMGKKRFKLVEQPAAKRHGLHCKMQVWRIL